jgi:hypothetical protein
MLTVNHPANCEYFSHPIFGNSGLVEEIAFITECYILGIGLALS